MKISLNWIKDYVDIENENVYDMADKITNCGVNVEHVVTNNLNNLVIGHVISCTPHPDSDHLNVCEVDILNEKLQIVCGAKNVRTGIKVIVAKVGAVLPGNFKIKESTIRGIKSYGMICALFELGLEEKTEENYNKGIYELDDDAPVGEDPIKYLGLDDTIYELDLNPNRSDCTNHLGFAYEVASVLVKKVKLPNTDFTEVGDDISSKIHLDVKTPNCMMYQTRIVKDVVVKESPSFIKNRLEAAGMRSINNVVDISNYVMLEYGQPLHFFDKEKLGDNITIRMARDNEKIVTLDNVERTLNNSDIVIAKDDEAVAIAGVMGGLSTEVDEDTRTILIESALFNPYNVRYTSIRLGLRSEASLRFEKPLNYEYTKEAIDRACYLLEKYADGKVLTGTVVYDNVDKTLKIAQVSYEKINKVLGITVPKEEVKNSFDRLGFPFTCDNDIYTVTIPNRRIDVRIKEDLIEEVGRLYGFDKIANKTPILPIKSGNYSPFVKFRKDVSKRLRTLGLNEVKTYTLISEEENKLFNNEEGLKVLLPMSLDRTTTRTSLLSSLYKVYKYNDARSVSNINIYEVSNVYHNDYTEELKLACLMKGDYVNSTWQDNTIPVNFFVLKGIISNLLDYLGYQNRYVFKESCPNNEMHPGVCANIYVDNEEIGYFGKVSPLFEKADIFVLEISLTKLYNKKVSKIVYPKISKYPEIKKDVAFIVDDEITSDDIKKIIKKYGTNTLKDVYVFDLYKGSNIETNKKSLAFSLTFVDYEKTLTEEEVDVLFKKIIEKVCTLLNAVVRDK
ncbi:MAG: phenylalanine--tRNA ligase subunit beta [bacterium]|nr:phenylalanine--tRNA ligase subunit beta [bacterium]